MYNLLALIFMTIFFFDGFRIFYLLMANNAMLITYF